MSVFNFKYKTDFKINNKNKKFIDKQISKKNFYVNDDGIIVSKEYFKNEKTDKFYNKEIKRGYMRNKKRRYYDKVFYLCKKYYFDFNDILEIGAGTGYFSKLFIDKFKPKKYTVYEFSKSADIFEKNVKSLITKIILKRESFKNIKILDNYDCFIALEILEHIIWDKVFLSSIPSGKLIFFSVPIIHDKQHVRAFLTPDSIAYRYKDILNIKEILGSSRNIANSYKDEHFYPTHWAVVAERI